MVFPVGLRLFFHNLITPSFSSGLFKGKNFLSLAYLVSLGFLSVRNTPKLCSLPGNGLLFGCCL